MQFEDELKQIIGGSAKKDKKDEVKKDRKVKDPKKEPKKKVKDKKDKKDKKEKKEKKVKLKKEVRKKANKGCTDVVYLDNNATTIICKEAKKEMMHWVDECYNPSSDSHVAMSARKMLESAQDDILRHCGVSSDTHYALFTSGATESNCSILRSTCEAYRKMRGIMPHIVSSVVEHHSILECLEILKDNDMCEYTLVECSPEGSIKPALIVEAIKPNTCLISIMYANNELGTINNIYAIGAIAHEHQIPMHTDAVQAFGKFRMQMDYNNIDAVSASLHKLHGPRGIGLLILSKKLVDGYKLQPMIAGTQQHGMRGGTENIPAIAGANFAIKQVFKHREVKNKKMWERRMKIIESLSSVWNRQQYKDFLSNVNQPPDAPRKILEKPGKPIFVVLGPGEEEKTRYLPNTLLIAFVNPKELIIYGPPPQDLVAFCNRKLKKDLDKDNIVVSITSACLTSSDKASHVLRAINAPTYIKRGVIRVSTSDYTTDSQINLFIRKLQEAVEKQIR